MPGTSVRLAGRGLFAFMATHTLDVFNDNFFKFTILSLIAAVTVNDQGRFGDLQAWANALFALPFILLAAWAGWLADRCSKSRLIVVTKLGEVIVMLAAWAAFRADSIPMLLAVVGLSSVQSAFFSPAKYGYLAETVDERRLSNVNGMAAMAVFVASVAGQAAGPMLYYGFTERMPTAAWVFVGVALAGWLCSFAIPAVPASQPRASFPLHPFASLGSTARAVIADRRLLYTMAGIGHFYLLVVVLQTVMLIFSQQRLGLTSLQGLPMAIGVVGMAMGSLLAARWSETKIELGLVPLGALAMSLFILILPQLQSLWSALGCTFFMGVAGGLFIVPLNATLQYYSPQDSKGRFQAFSNLVTFVGIIIAAGIVWGLNALRLPIAEQLLAVSLLSLLGTAVSLWLLPESFVRFCGWLLAHTIYRIRVRFRGNLPSTGGALLVSNHVSWVDALVLSAVTRRRLHFLMYRRYFLWWPTRWFFKLVGCLPVAAGDPPEVLAASLDAAGKFLEEGHLVVIFAEGTVTRTGQLLPFKKGYQHIVAGRDVPIIPVHLDGLWGSIFSHERGRLLWKLPRAFPYPVTVSVGPSLPSSAEPHEVAHAIRMLASGAWRARRRSRLPLHETLLREERRSLRAALWDAEGRAFSRGKLIARALALRGRLAPRLGSSPAVGLSLTDPRDAILALQCAGRVPVMLDPTLDAAGLAAAAAACGFDTVIREGPAPRPPTDATVMPDTIDIHALGRGAGAGSWRLLGWILPSFLYAPLAIRGPRGDPDAPAVIFHIGGKAVTLSHHNVLSNVEALREVLNLRPDDLLLAALPAHVPTGFAVSLWLPLLADLRVTMSGAGPIGRRVEQREATLLFATPHQLRRYLRDERPERFGSLRLVAAVGGRLDEQLADAWRYRFGIEPLAGYSEPHCGPIVALNTPDVRGPGVFQRAHKRGSVGQPLPGVTVGAPYGIIGRLVVFGPGVVRERADEGWETDEQGTLDKDGFLTLADAREGSPEAVERAIRLELGRAEVALAVLPAAERASGAVVFHERGRFDPARIRDGLLGRWGEQPWIPRESDWVEVDDVPLSPGGEVDAPALARLLRPVGTMEP